MSVVVETTLGDITVDLYLKERPRACLNFLKLCKVKYYNYNLFHTISHNFIAQTGDPTGSRIGGESIFGVLEGPLKRYFEAETTPKIKHTTMGLISFVGNEERMIGSQFFFTLSTDLTYLDEQHCVFGEVVEGMDVIELLNEVICDNDNRPYQDVRITHTVILEDPYPDPPKLRVPDRSPSPSAERLAGGRIAPDEEIDETVGKSYAEINEMIAEREAKARATILEMVGDIPDAEMAPPENVLFVCKLNPVTTDDDLEIIFSRFGKIKSCEVIRDKKTGDSLQYAFVEFEDQKACEDAYFKMDNVLIDDRRIHVDFSQSVAKVKWHGKGRGVTHYDDKGKKTTDKNNELGKGKYKYGKNKNVRPKEESKDKEDYKHTEKSKGHYGDRKNNRDYYGRNYQPYRHRQRNNSPHRNRRSRSPHKKDRSRSPKRRNRSKSPNKRNRSRSPVRKDRNRSPVQQKRRQDSKYRDDKHEKHKSRKEQKKYDSSSDFSDDDRKKKTKSSKKSKEEIKRKDHKGGRSKSSSDSDSEENIKNKKKKKKSRRRSSNSSSD